MLYSRKPLKTVIFLMEVKMFLIKVFMRSWRDGSAVEKIRDWLPAPAQYDSTTT